MKNIHKRLRKAREDNNKTQAEMAEALGISQPRYQQIESGKRPDMRVSTLRKLCEELDISADWLLGIE